MSTVKTRLEKLERAMKQDKQATSVTGTDIDAAIQDERMIELEQQINNLYVETARQAELATPLEIAAKAIFSLQRQVTALKKDVERLETIALEAVEAEAIANLRTTAIEHSERIERLEAALETWLIVVNWDNAASLPMHEMDVTAGKPVYSAPE